MSIQGGTNGESSSSHQSNSGDYLPKRYVYKARRVVGGEGGTYDSTDPSRNAAAELASSHFGHFE